jgi:hypothetical protein
MSSIGIFIAGRDLIDALAQQIEGGVSPQRPWGPKFGACRVQEQQPGPRALLDQQMVLARTRAAPPTPTYHLGPPKGGRPPSAEWRVGAVSF